MPGKHQLSWLLEGRVIIAEMEGNWDEKDVPGFDRDVLHLLDQTNAERAHIIADVSRMTGIVPITALTQQVKFVHHPRLNWIVAVGARTNPLVHAAASMGAILFGINFREERTMTEALRYLNRMDSSLPDLTKLNRKIPPAE